MHLDSLQKYKATTLLKLQQTSNRLLNSSQSENERLSQKADESIYKWGAFLAYLAITSTFFTLFCFTFIEAFKAGITTPFSQGPINSKTHTEKTQSKTQVPFNPKRHVPQGSLPLSNPHKHTKELDFVSIDKLIKRTRMQWKRSLDTNKEERHRANNRQKALENIAFLKSIGISVLIDKNEKTKLIIDKKEIV